MTQSSSELSQTWSGVVGDLIARSEQANSDIPTLSHKQRAFLHQAHPVVIVDGYVLLAVVDKMTKMIIENDLGPHIATVLQERTGRHYSVAVTIDPDAVRPRQQTLEFPPAEPSQPAQPTQPAQPAPQVPQMPQPQPQQPQQPQQFGWQPTHSTTGYPGGYPADPTTAIPPVTGVGLNLPPQQAPIQQPIQQQPLQQPIQPQHVAPQQAPRLPRETPATNPNRSTSLNQKYTFDSFVTGSSNRFAHSAAVAVAENPARAYNPLFISGDSGLGKTHLLHAAGNYAQQLRPELRVLYVSGEEFTNDYINSVRDDRQESFKRRYRNLDILMVDDIQFLQGKEATQEEFFHTFNALHQANKQIILSSDRPPKELTTLEDRLRTRFQAGLIADIQPPDLETRIAILMKKAEADGIQADPAVFQLIASRIDSSIRELEGALIRVSAYSSLAEEPINMAIAEEALRDILPEVGVEITPQAIMDATAEHFDLTVDILCGSGKTRPVAHARQIAMYLCRELTDLSLPKIGAEFGGKDHSTVIYAENKIRKEMTQKRETYDEIQQLTQAIKSRGRTR